MKFIQTKAGLIIMTIVLLGIGFLSGMEYKAFQIRSALRNVFTDNASTPPKTPETVMGQASQEGYKVIEKNIGDEVILTLGKIKVIDVKESQTITSRYGTPKTAGPNAKFVIVGMEITNITDSTFSFPADDTLTLVDNSSREFRTYSETIGNIDNYLNMRELSPSIPETGVIVFEVPQDASGYSLVTTKLNNKELYKIILK